MKAPNCLLLGQQILGHRNLFGPGTSISWNPTRDPPSCRPPCAAPIQPSSWAQLCHGMRLARARRGHGGMVRVLTFACLPIWLQRESDGAAASHASGRVLARPVTASVIYCTRLWGGKETGAQPPTAEAAVFPHPGGEGPGDRPGVCCGSDTLTAGPWGAARPLCTSGSPSGTRETGTVPRGHREARVC